MSKHLKLAIVGRPNVGKSALFNRICGRRIAIVDEAEGVTRDRLYKEVVLMDRPCQLIDTGGVNAQSKAVFNQEIKEQAELAIAEADACILVVDAIVGLTDPDLEVGRMLLKAKKPLCVAVNKVDDPSKEVLVHQFYQLGIQDMVPVSAAHGLNMATLIQIILDKTPVIEEGYDTVDHAKVAIVGKTNVGKSTLINKLLDDTRCIVSPIPGTTRDSIDVSIEADGVPYTFIDTAGIRRKHSELEVVDKFATIRTAKAIERADVCLMMLDAISGVSHQDKKILNMIEEAGKGCIIIFNKWDLIKEHRMEHLLQAVRQECPFVNHCPILIISALQGKHLDKIFTQIEVVYREGNRTVNTAKLNQFLVDAQIKHHPPMLKGRRLRIYYMTQFQTQPPQFLLFLNKKDNMTKTYLKYLYNQFRLTFGFIGNPVKFILKGKKST